MQLLFLVLFLFVAHTLAVPWVGQARKEAFWVARHNDLIAQTNAHRADVKVVFFGDSITEKWNLQGLPIWNTYYAPRHSYNYGIGGDKVEHLIYRLANHELDGINPKIVVLEIGSNNIDTDYPDTPQDIAHGIKELIHQILLKFPMTKIILMGIPPVADKTKELKMQQTNSLILPFADNIHVFYLDLSPQLQTSPGVEKPGLYVDGVHFSKQGFLIWAETMEPLFKKLYD